MPISSEDLQACLAVGTLVGIYAYLVVGLTVMDNAEKAIREHYRKDRRRP